MGVVMHIPLSGVPHGNTFHTSTFISDFTEWDGFTLNVEFVATGPGIAIITGRANAAGEFIQIIVDKDDAGTDIKTYTMEVPTNWEVVTAPFDKGDGVTIAHHAGVANITARVYYFS